MQDIEKMVLILKETIQKTFGSHSKNSDEMGKEKKNGDDLGICILNLLSEVGTLPSLVAICLVNVEM